MELFFKHYSLKLNGGGLKNNKVKYFHISQVSHIKRLEYYDSLILNKERMGRYIIPKKIEIKINSEYS